MRRKQSVVQPDRSGHWPMRRSQQLPGKFELIARYFALLGTGFPGARPLTDDAAAITPAVRHELAAKADLIVGGVHFLPRDPADLVACKALRINPRARQPDSALWYSVPPKIP